MGNSSASAPSASSSSSDLQIEGLEALLERFASPDWDFGTPVEDVVSADLEALSHVRLPLETATTEQLDRLIFREISHHFLGLPTLWPRPGILPRVLRSTSAAIRTCRRQFCVAPQQVLRDAAGQRELETALQCAELLRVLVKQCLEQYSSEELVFQLAFGWPPGRRPTIAPDPLPEKGEGSIGQAARETEAESQIPGELRVSYGSLHRRFCAVSKSDPRRFQESILHWIRAECPQDLWLLTHCGILFRNVEEAGVFFSTAELLDRWTSCAKHRSGSFHVILSPMGTPLPRRKAKNCDASIAAPNSSRGASQVSPIVEFFEESISFCLGTQAASVFCNRGLGIAQFLHVSSCLLEILLFLFSVVVLNRATLRSSMAPPPPPSMASLNGATSMFSAAHPTRHPNCGVGGSRGSSAPKEYLMHCPSVSTSDNLCSSIGAKTVPAAVIQHDSLMNMAARLLVPPLSEPPDQFLFLPFFVSFVAILHPARDPSMPPPQNGVPSLILRDWLQYLLTNFWMSRPEIWLRFREQFRANIVPKFSSPAIATTPPQRAGQRNEQLTFTPGVPRRPEALLGAPRDTEVANPAGGFNNVAQSRSPSVPSVEHHATFEELIMAAGAGAPGSRLIPWRLADPEPTAYVANLQNYRALASFFSQLSRVSAALLCTGLVHQELTLLPSSFGSMLLHSTSDMKTLIGCDSRDGGASHVSPAGPPSTTPTSDLSSGRVAFADRAGTASLANPMLMSFQQLTDAAYFPSSSRTMPSAADRTAGASLDLQHDPGVRSTPASVRCSSLGSGAADSTPLESVAPSSAAGNGSDLRTFDNQIIKHRWPLSYDLLLAAFCSPSQLFDPLYALTFYFLVYRNRSFRVFCTARTDPATIVLPLLQLITSASEIRSTEHARLQKKGKLPIQITLALLVLLLLTRDRNFTSSLFIEDGACCGIPDWLQRKTKEDLEKQPSSRVLAAHSTSSPGSLAILVLTRFLSWNFSSYRDKYTGSLAAAVLWNISLLARNLHWRVAEGVVRFCAKTVRQLLFRCRSFTSGQEVQSSRSGVDASKVSSLAYDIEEFAGLCHGAIAVVAALIEQGRSTQLHRHILGESGFPLTTLHAFLRCEELHEDLQYLADLSITLRYPTAAGPLSELQLQRCSGPSSAIQICPQPSVSNPHCVQNSQASHTVCTLHPDLFVTSRQAQQASLMEGMVSHHPAAIAYRKCVTTQLQSDSPNKTTPVSDTRPDTPVRPTALPPPGVLPAPQDPVAITPCLIDSSLVVDAPLPARVPSAVSALLPWIRYLLEVVNLFSGVRAESPDIEVGREDLLLPFKAQVEWHLQRTTDDYSPPPTTATSSLPSQRARHLNAAAAVLNLLPMSFSETIESPNYFVPVAWELATLVVPYIVVLT